MASGNMYDTGKPALGKTAMKWLLITVVCWALADIFGASSTAQTMLLVGLGLGLMLLEWHTYRRWQKHVETPALLRKNLAPLLRTDLPPRSLTTGGHGFGSFLTPGPPKRIKISQSGLPPLEGDLASRIQYVVNEICQNEYVIKAKKSEPGKKIVLVQKPEEQVVVLTPQQQVEQNIIKAVQEIFPKHTPKAAYEWSDDSDEPYLLGVTITDINGMDLALSGKRRQILTKLRTRLPRGNFVSDVDPNGDALAFTRSRPLPSMVVPPATHAPLLTSHKAYEEFFVPLGVGNDGEMAVWHPRKDAHLLIIGGTGGGKTIAEHGVIQRLAQAGWRIWLVDGKRIEFIGYRKWANVELLAQNVDDQIRVLKLAHETMEARYDLIERGEVRIQDLDPIAIVVDELTSLLGAVKRRYLETKIKGMPTKDPVLDWMADLARLGRTAKMHLVEGLQRPDAAIMGGEMRDNFGARVSAGPLKSKEASMMLWDDPAIGVSVPNIKGRAVSVINGNPGMIQSTYTANPDLDHPDYHIGMVEAMRPKVEAYSRKTIAKTEPKADSDDDEVTWTDIIESAILDDDGSPVEFDPISSEESKALRSKYGHQELAADAYQLQTADSFEQAIELFPYDPTLKLTYGGGVAKKLAHLAEHLQLTSAQEATKTVRAHHIKPAATPELGQGDMTELRYIEPGQSIVAETIGDEEIMVASCEPDQDDPETYYLSGWTQEGEEIHLELPADTNVEAFDLETI